MTSITHGATGEITSPQEDQQRQYLEGNLHSQHTLENKASTLVKQQRVAELLVMMLNMWCGFTHEAGAVVIVHRDDDICAAVGEKATEYGQEDCCNHIAPEAW